MRTVQLSILDSVKIAAPCPVAWDSMEGDDRRRHCDQCDLNVFNISDMTREEAEVFLAEAAANISGGGRVCAGFWKRHDGTILTKNCPVGLAAVRAAVARKVSRLVGAAALLFGAAISLAARNRGQETRLRQMEPFSQIATLLNPVVPFLGPMARPPSQMWVAGDIAFPTPPVVASPPKAVKAPKAPKAVKTTSAKH